ncbi:MAG: rRNA maturation RNase YbeY [Verrucomicrobia bacterium]|nr:rRNA maturation RNase YbeY [Verrucomicrobiota bacterium]
MSGELSLQNRQRIRAVNLRLLRQITNFLLTDLLSVKDSSLGLHLVAAPEMTRLNEDFLDHSGTTDVITFNHADHATRHTHHAARLHGEIFICVDEAVIQSRRFRTTWQSELVRYLVHGLLHLRGHDDAQPAARRQMKREEDRLVRQLTQQFHLALLDRATRSTGIIPTTRTRAANRAGSFVRATTS